MKNVNQMFSVTVMLKCNALIIIINYHLLIIITENAIA